MYVWKHTLQCHHRTQVFLNIIAIQQLLYQVLFRTDTLSRVAISSVSWYPFTYKELKANQTHQNPPVLILYTSYPFGNSVASPIVLMTDWTTYCDKPWLGVFLICCSCGTFVPTLS